MADSVARQLSAVRCFSPRSVLLEAERPRSAPDRVGPAPSVSRQLQRGTPDVSAT